MATAAQKDAKRPKAYSYIRFSSKRQKEGDSYQRQIEAAERYAAEHDPPLDLDDTLHDEGTPAFRGENMREEAALGGFIRKVEEGEVEAGSYLLVEDTDRITRRDPLLAIEDITRLCRAVINVVTIRNRQVYSYKKLLKDPACLYLLLGSAQRANEESVRKSGLAKEAWIRKRENARKNKLTARCPAWLKLNKKTGKFDKKADRVKIVKWLFRETLKGKGMNTLAAELNRREEPVWGPTRNGNPPVWHVSYIAKILKNEAVIGTYHPHSTGTGEDDDGPPKRKPVGKPVTRYYPAVVTKKDFQAVQALRKTRTPQRGRHAGKEVRNADAVLR